LYTVQAAPTLAAELTDGQRILATDGRPVLDIYTVDYRDRLDSSPETATAFGAQFRLLTFTVWYFLRALHVAVSARKRAKSPMARLPLVTGFGAALTLLFSVVLTAVAIAVTFGLVAPARFLIARLTPSRSA